MVGALRVPLDDYRTDDTTSMKAECVHKGIHGSVERPAGAASPMLQPVVEKLVGVSAGQRCGLGAREPDSLLDVVKGDVAGEGFVYVVQTNKIKCRSLAQAELREYAFDQGRDQCGLWTCYWHFSSHY